MSMCARCPRELSVHDMESGVRVCTWCMSMDMVDDAELEAGSAPVTAEGSGGESGGRGRATASDGGGAGDGSHDSGGGGEERLEWRRGGAAGRKKKKPNKYAHRPT